MSKIRVLPEEMLLSFSIENFLTNYDVISRKLEHVINTLQCTKTNKKEGRISQWRLLDKEPQ